MEEEEEDHVTHNDAINVLVALVEVLDDFLEVSTQQVFIWEELLLGGQLANVLLLRRVSLTDNGHRVVMFLTVEDHIETSLMELTHWNAIGALSEDLDLLFLGVNLSSNQSNFS